MSATAIDLEVSRYFRESYICWAIGQLDPLVEKELDELTSSGWENWKAVMEREYGLRAEHFRNLQTLLCTAAGLSSQEALDVLLRAESP